ncbi:MAG: hypothetical protein M1820_002749 [Bogoriella megaspora]|nr:MAG: hypothetical protein M1820_002749 [Bogoriella megaspora]
MFTRCYRNLPRWNLNPLTRNTRNWPPHVRSTPFTIQIANFVKITKIEGNKPLQSLPTLVMHHHPNADYEGHKLYDVDVWLAEDDSSADACWRFQIAEGEDEMDRLLAYAQSFRKRGLPVLDCDEYVKAFQEQVYGMWLKNKYYR